MRTGHHRERDSLVSAATEVFRALAPALVGYGVSVREAESLLRAVSVHEVANLQTARGKRPNASRIALLTGLDRKEITRILRRAPRIDPSLEARCHRANKVLSGWYGDGTFVHDDKPLVLPIKSKERERPTFWMLASRYAPGVYPGLILNELSRVGALEKLRDGRVRVRMRWYRSTKDLGKPGSRRGG